MTEEERKQVESESEDSEEVEDQPELELEKDVVDEIPEKGDEEEGVSIRELKSLTGFDMTSWEPKTNLGKQVKNKELTDIDAILSQGHKILEPEIVDALVPNLESELLMIGQSKGKFGGGAKRVFRQTQKKTPEGNKPSFATVAVVGNRDGYVGVGFGKSKDTVPAREKAIRNAKLNVFKIPRGCGSWECACSRNHSVPFEVQGKCGSVIVKFMPAPRGKGLIVEKEISKIMALAGFKDLWSKSKGQTKVKVNMIKAAVAALHKLATTKTAARHVAKQRAEAQA